MMRSSSLIWSVTSLTCLLSEVCAYVDFGTQTISYNVYPTFGVEIPHHIDPNGFYHVSREYAHHSHITAIAPSATVFLNGSGAVYYSIHSASVTSQSAAASLEPTGVKGVFARQNAVFGTQLFGGGANSCCACDANGRCPSVVCRPAAYSGIFAGIGGLSNGTTNTFVIDLPITTTTQPCCPVCSTTPPNSATSGPFTATTGVFASSSVGGTGLTSAAPVSTTVSISTSISISTVVSTDPSGVLTTSISSMSVPVTVTSTISSIVTPPRTAITVTAPVVTRTRVTLSVETITPSVTGVVPAFMTDAPLLATVNTSVNTVLGCGTAYGCGTVNGSGTVYLPPFGFPVTSSGLVSGCAQSMVGCGVMLGTSGTFSGSATVIGCGTGSGMATMIGSGTVYPAGFTPEISFVSSGTVTGSGRVVGCGTLMGSGVFTLTGPPTNLPTVTARKTVNVYVSYCPDDNLNGGNLARIVQYAAGGNVSTETSNGHGKNLPNTGFDAEAESGLSSGSSTQSLNSSGGYLLDPVFANATTIGPNNSISNNNTQKNPLCHICPNDSGICCPLFTDCGVDGHCPYQALLGAGYLRFGMNIVDMANSSSGIGGGVALSGKTMNAALKAPGKPGEYLHGVAGTIDEMVSANAASQRLRRKLERAVGAYLKGHSGAARHDLGQ